LCLGALFLKMFVVDVEEVLLIVCSESEELVWMPLPWIQLNFEGLRWLSLYLGHLVKFLHELAVV